MNQNNIEVFDDFDLDDNQSTNLTNNIQNPSISQVQATTPVYNNQMQNTSVPQVQITTPVYDNQVQNTYEQPSTTVPETKPVVTKPTIPDLDKVESVFADPIKIEKKPIFNPNENPVADMISNKTTIKLIIILLVILFAAVFLMPNVIQWLNK